MPSAFSHGLMKSGRVSHVLRHGGFFHLDAHHKDHPVDLLEDALRKSGQEALFGESLVVLPEAFNIIGDYQMAALDPDPEVEKRLIILSSKLGLCFVVGLVRDDSARRSEAVLIDGSIRKVLSLKTLCDGSKCYNASTQQKDEIIPHRGLCIGALICMDAAEGYKDKDFRDKQKVRHAKLLEEFRKCAEITLLCVPARFGATAPVEVANVWNQEGLSIIIGNCGTSIYPSVLHFDNGQTCTAPTDRDCHIHLGALPSQKRAP
jgi:hypothetical protein